MKFFSYIFVVVVVLLLVFISCGETNSSVKKEDKVSPVVSENHFLFSTDQLLKLKRVQNKAEKTGVVLANTSDFVRGQWVLDQDTFKVEVKLISAYHSFGFSPGTTAYRVKLKNGNIQGVRVLNIYPVDAFDFQQQLFIHNMCKRLGVLSPKVGQVSSKFDTDSTIDFVWIEHFEKQLLESQKSREAPIFKLDVRPYKDLILKEKEKRLDYYGSFFSKVNILPFNRKITWSDESLKLQYSNGKFILDQLRKGKLDNLSSMVDVEKLATFYVLKDYVLGDSVPIPWYNLRYYYNSTNAKLEPIVYALDADVSDSRILEESKAFENKLKNNKEFKDAYDFVKQRIDDDNFVHEISDETNKMLDELPGDYKKYTRQTLSEILHVKHDLTIDLKNKFAVMNEPLPSFALRLEDLNTKMEITNLYSKSLEIIGTGIESGILLDINKLISPDSKLVVPNPHPIIYYKVEGREAIYKYGFVQPPSVSSNIGLQIRAKSKIPDGFRQQGDSLFYVGQHQIYTSDIIIPTGYAVFFPKGSVLELNNCSFLSFSPIFAKGTTEDPILFYSNKANGFTIIDANKSSELSYVTFDRFGNQLFTGWELPGAVTFNHSEVTFSHCTFSNNTCEDALNIVGTNFTVDNCKFENTFGDAFDADFCTGTVSYSHYINIGNDAMDFSGSEIEIANCDIKYCGDKGVSAGENSTLDIVNISIDKAIIGIASKDKSMVIAKNISLSNCDRNFAVFQKKKEYGPAKIEVVGGNIASGKLENIIDKNSVFILDDIKIVGEKSIDVNSLY